MSGRSCGQEEKYFLLGKEALARATALPQEQLLENFLVISESSLLLEQCMKSSGREMT